MNESQKGNPGRIWLWLALLAILIVLAALLAASYLRARYNWRDVPFLLGHMAQQISQQRLVAAIALSIAGVWLLVRRRSSRSDTYAALMAYLGGLLADGVVLLSLEPLGISYGPVLLPLALLAALRCAVAVGLGAIALLLTARGRHRALWPVLHGLGQALVLVVVVDAFVLEPTHLTVSHLAVADPFQINAPPLRIVQISDPHLERKNRLLQRVIDEANALQPDLIVLTGDYLNTSYTQDPQAHADLRQLISGLQARHGIYAISGNVDAMDVGPLFEGLPVTVLTNRWEMREIAGRQVALAGVAVHRNLAVGRDRAAERRALAELVRTMPKDRLTILLHHTPDLIPEAVAAGFDLYLCGHTHGGQVRLPIYGALTTFSLYGKRYEMGTYVEGETTIYVSRGIGLEGWVLPRVRLLCPPEIVLVEVR